MTIKLEGKLRRFQVIVSPDKLVIPEHFSITRTARTGHTGASSAASRIENAKSLNALGVHFAGKPINPFR
jgi:hypothetical protein